MPGLDQADRVSTLDVARWQFAVTTVYHFLFVPLTIGLSMLVAGMQTAWVRTDNPIYLRMTKFWGKLFLINFAIGVATGIVQEFQFGMNWSSYSRFVGDVFGAPLAMEGLLAFFLESTFLGLWIFGWDKLPKKLHLATIWVASIGTMISAYFILAANSWMQHPVGYRIDHAKNRAELTSIWKLLTNSNVLVTFPHVIFGAFITAGAFVLGISVWHLARRKDTEFYRKSMRIALATTFVASIGVMASGHIQGQVMTRQQPMKMAAAEALYHTEKPASFSLFTIGSLNGSKEIYSLRVPGVLSFLATGSFSGKVDGIDEIQAEYAERYGPGSYLPDIPVTYWTFRLMMGFGFLAAFLSIAGLWISRRKRAPTSRWFVRAALCGMSLPFLANTAGWIFTEMGRQPWTVFGLMQTKQAVSPTVGLASVITSLTVFTLLYGGLALINVKIMLRTIRAGAPSEESLAPTDGVAPTLAFSY
jgi:cytochrome d ubiquinol oxidase subunit I